MLFLFLKPTFDEFVNDVRITLHDIIVIFDDRTAELLLLSCWFAAVNYPI